jgi:hypothetical protein
MKGSRRLMQRVFGDVFEYSGTRGVALMDGDTKGGAHGWHNPPAPVSRARSLAGDPLHEKPALSSMNLAP